jgi:hypothetical protein
MLGGLPNSEDRFHLHYPTISKIRVSYKFFTNQDFHSKNVDLNGSLFSFFLINATFSFVNTTLIYW